MHVYLHSLMDATQYGHYVKYNHNRRISSSTPHNVREHPGLDYPTVVLNEFTTLSILYDINIPHTEPFKSTNHVTRPNHGPINLSPHDCTIVNVQGNGAILTLQAGQNHWKVQICIIHCYCERAHPSFSFYDISFPHYSLYKYLVGCYCVIGTLFRGDIWN